MKKTTVTMFSTKVSILVIFGIFIFRNIVNVESSLVRKKPQHVFTVQLFQEDFNETTSTSNTTSSPLGDRRRKPLKEPQNKHNNNNNANYENLLNDLNSNTSFIQYKNELRAIHYGKATVMELRGGNRRRHQNPSAWKNISDWSSLENWKKEQQQQNNSNGEKIPKKIVCYYNVPTYQDQPFAVFPEQIDPFMCTHIIVGFAHITNSTIQPGSLKDFEFYNRTVALKKLNKDLKVMLSVGGAGNNNGFPEMVSTKGNRTRFIQDSVEFLKRFSFDGLDCDWEFPTWSGKMEEKDQLLIFFQEYREYTEKIHHPMILSAAVPSPKAIIDLSYDVTNLAKVLDFINLMTYDFHFYTWYTPFTGPNAPLFKSAKDIGILTTLNTAWSAKYWYQSGMPAHKVIVGVPTYGHTYKLVDKRERGYDSLALDIGTVGSRGYISYPEICQFLQGNGSYSVFDNETRVPYAYDEHNWISYDNEQSVREKAQWVNEYSLGGVMVYAINSDDAWKICNTSQVTFPLIHVMKTELFPQNKE